MAHLPDNTKERSLPVILLIDKGMTTERRVLAAWLANSRFSACDALDMFEAIGELADFTVRNDPDVIVLNTEPCAENVELIRSLLREESGSDPEILTLSSRGAEDQECFVGDLPAVTARLDALIPERLSH